MNGSLLQSLLEALPGRKVLVVGDVMLDEYWWGDVSRVSPEAPVPVVKVRERTFAPGGAANTAANVVSLSGHAVLGGAVGRDEASQRLFRALERTGVARDGLIVLDELMTTTKTRLIARGQQVVRVDHEECVSLPEQMEEALLRWAEHYLPEVDACLLSDYGKGVVSARLTKQLIGSARRLGKPVVVDPKGADYSKYRGACVIKPNVHEVEHYLKEDLHSEDRLREAGHRLVGLLDGTSVVITPGADGMTLFQAGLPSVEIETQAHNVFDVTGAGDTVVAALAMALGAGACLQDAVHLASLAAGVVVGKRGTATVGLAELRNGIPSKNGITSVDRRHPTIVL